MSPVNSMRVEASRIRIIKILFFCILVYYIILAGILAGFFPPFVPNYNKTDKFLSANIDELSYVVAALSAFDDESITIRKFPLRDEDRHNMVVSNGLDSETIPIPVELIDHIESLFTVGVEVIRSGSDLATFSLWSSLSESRGIIYSKSGEFPDGIQFIEMEELSEDNWYYYVHNYEKAKVLNPHLFE